MNYTTIAWDWNGTLLDDAYICMECVNDMLRKRNMDVLDLDTYRRLVETPIIKAYEHIFDLSVVTFDTIVKEFYDSYPRYAASAKPCTFLMRMIISISKRYPRQRKSPKPGISA